MHRIQDNVEEPAKDKVYYFTRPFPEYSTATNYNLVTAKVVTISDTIAVSLDDRCC